MGLETEEREKVMEGEGGERERRRCGQRILLWKPAAGEALGAATEEEPGEAVELGLTCRLRGHRSSGKPGSESPTRSPWRNQADTLTLAGVLQTHDMGFAVPGPQTRSPLSRGHKRVNTRVTIQGGCRSTLTRFRADPHQRCAPPAGDPGQPQSLSPSREQLPPILSNLRSGQEAGIASLACPLLESTSVCSGSQLRRWARPGSLHLPHQNYLLGIIKPLHEHELCGGPMLMALNNRPSSLTP